MKTLAKCVCDVRKKQFKKKINNIRIVSFKSKEKFLNIRVHALAMVSDRAGLRPAAERARRVYVFVNNTSR